MSISNAEIDVNCKLAANLLNALQWQNAFEVLHLKCSFLTCSMFSNGGFAACGPELAGQATYTYDGTCSASCKSQALVVVGNVGIISVERIRMQSWQQYSSYAATACKTRRNIP